MGRVELRRVKAVWDGAINGKLFELVLDGGEIEEVKKRGPAVEVLINPYSSN